MVEIISKEELLRKIQGKEKFFLVDVRDTPDYNMAHIVGAIHLLISEMDTKIDSMFKKDDLIITYSLDTNCPASGIAAEKMKTHSFQKVLRYKDGWNAWKEANFPIE